MEELNNSQKNNKPKVRVSVYWLYGIILVVLMGLLWTNNTSDVKELGWTEFQQLAKDDVFQKMEVFNKKNIVEATVKNEYKHVVFKENLDRLGSNPKVYVKIPSPDKFSEFYDKIKEENDISAHVNYKEGEDVLWNILMTVAPFAILIFLWIFFMKRMAGGGMGGPGGVFSVGKAKAQLFDKNTNNKVTFKDVAGLSEAKQEVEEIVSFLKNPGKYTELGGKIPKGALLVGPPGTGKTLLAKAVAGEANVPFLSLSGSDFVEMFVGVGASRVRDLFRQAKEKAPCIVFIDEIDAVGRARGKNTNMNSNDERESTLNQLLTEMDGFSTNTGVIILAATNRADILDRALLRAGRFDRQIHVELPNAAERKGIFEVHVRNLKLSPEVDLEYFAKQTPGFSGADIANVCNEAALIAARNGKKCVEKDDFLAAIDRIIGGLERRGNMISPEEKKVIAYHEAGHAAVSWLVEHASPLVKVTIVPRGKSLGAAWYLPEERHITTTEQMFDELTATLGGRAAEEVQFGKISTGALSDLEKVTKQAFAMVVYYGLNETIGNISFYDSTGQQEYALSKPYSEKTAQQIDEEISKLIESAYKRAKNILIENKDKLTQLADILIEKEVIFAEDLENIFGKRKYQSEKLS